MDYIRKRSASTLYKIPGYTRLSTVLDNSGVNYTGFTGFKGDCTGVPVVKMCFSFQVDLGLKKVKFLN